MTREIGGNSGEATQHRLQSTIRSLFHLCQDHNRAASDEIEAYAHELANYEIDRILEVIEKASLGQLHVPFALEDGVRVVLSMPRLWASCISLLLQLMQTEQISGHTAMLMMSEMRMCLVMQHRKIQLSSVALSASDSAIQQLQAVCKRCLQPFMHDSSTFTAGEVLCLELLPVVMRLLAGCPVCDGVVEQIIEHFLDAKWPPRALLPIMSTFADVAYFIHADTWMALMEKIRNACKSDHDKGDFSGLIRLCLRLSTSRVRTDDSTDLARKKSMTTDWLNCARVLYSKIPEAEIQTVEVLLEQYLLQVPLIVQELVALIESSCAQILGSSSQENFLDPIKTQPLSWQDIRFLMLLGRSFRIPNSERALYVNHARGANKEMDLTAFRRQIYDNICKVLITCLILWSHSEVAQATLPAPSSSSYGSLDLLLIRTLGNMVDIEHQSSQSSQASSSVANFSTAASCARAELLLTTCIRVIQLDKGVLPAIDPLSSQAVQRVNEERPGSKLSWDGKLIPTQIHTPANDYVSWASKIPWKKSSSIPTTTGEIAISPQSFARETLQHVYELVTASRATVVGELFQSAHQILSGPDQRVGWDKKSIAHSLQQALADIVNRRDQDEHVLKEFQRCMCCKSTSGMHQVRQLCRKQLQRPNYMMKSRAIEVMAAILPQVERAAQLDLIQALGFVFTFPVSYRRRLYAGIASHLLQCTCNAVTHSVHEDALRLLVSKLDKQLLQYFHSPDQQEQINGQLELNVSSCFDSTGGQHAEIVLKDDLAGLLIAKWLIEILSDQQSARGVFQNWITYFITAEGNSTESSKRQAMPTRSGNMNAYFLATMRFLENGFKEKEGPDRSNISIPQNMEWQLAYNLVSGVVVCLVIGCKLFIDETSVPSQQQCVEVLSSLQGLADILLELLQQKRFGRSHDNALQMLYGRHQMRGTSLSMSPSWRQLQHWLLDRQIGWLQQIGPRDKTKQYPKSVIVGALGYTVWELTEALVHHAACHGFEALRLLSSVYDGFATSQRENDVLALVPEWACAQPSRHGRQPSRRAVQKVQLMKHSAYMEAQPSHSDSEEESDALNADKPPTIHPPIQWGVGCATSFFQRVLNSLPTRVLSSLDRYGVECIRASGTNPRLVVDVTSNRIRMDIFQLRKQVLDALSGVATRWSEDIPGNVVDSEPSQVQPPTSPQLDAIPIYEYLAAEFEENIAKGLPVRLCMSYCDAIFSFVRCLKQTNLLVLRREGDGTVIFMRHVRTNVVFDVTTSANMRTCAILFNIVKKYSLPYNTILKKILDLILLLSENVLAVSKRFCQCCLEFDNPPAQSEKTTETNPVQTAPALALSSKAQCAQVFQHMLRAAESELLSSKPNSLSVSDLADFMTVFFGTFRVVPLPSTPRPSSTNRLVLDLLAIKTQARLLKMLAELLRKCVKELNRLILLHKVLKKLPKSTEQGDGFTNPFVEAEKADDRRPVATQHSAEPIGLSILRAVIGGVSIPIVNVRQWAKQRAAAQSDEVSSQLGNLLYRAEELELAGARFLHSLQNSEAFLFHARLVAQEAVAEVEETVHALLKEMSRHSARKRKISKQPPKARRSRRTNNDDSDGNDNDNRRIGASATWQRLASRRRILPEDEDDEENDDILGDKELGEGAVYSEADDSNSESDGESDEDELALPAQPVVKPARRRAKRVRLRSRHDVIDRWLADEQQNDDAFADLEDFIVA